MIMYACNSIHLAYVNVFMYYMYCYDVDVFMNAHQFNNISSFFLTLACSFRNLSNKTHFQLIISLDMVLFKMHNSYVLCWKRSNKG